MRFNVETANRPIRHVYFYDRGLASTVGSLNDRETEIAVTGFESMSGINVMLGGDQTPYDTYMQIEGSGSRMSVTAFREAMEMSKTLKAHLNAFARTTLIQMSSTVACNGGATIHAALARWLLMIHDRVEGDTFTITHDLLSVMVAARRPGVSEAMKKLHARGAISAKRGPSPSATEHN